MNDRRRACSKVRSACCPVSEARALDLFTEITNYDESACDAWIGPHPVRRHRPGARCSARGIRARNFGQLAGSAQTLDERRRTPGSPIGGPYGDITYPINSPLAITMGFAVSEAAQRQFRRRHGGPGGRPLHRRRAPGVVGQGRDLRRGPSAGPTSSTRSRAPGSGRTSFWLPRPASRTGWRRRTSACSPRPNAASPRRTRRRPARHARARSPGTWR